MGAYTPTRPTAPGVVAAPAAVSASDTIDTGLLGSLGCYLKIINGAGSGSDNVTISDASLTAASNPATTTPVAVGFGTAKWFYISPRAAGTGNNVTVVHSAPTTVSYELLPLG